MSNEVIGSDLYFWNSNIHFYWRSQPYVLWHGPPGLGPGDRGQEVSLSTDRPDKGSQTCYFSMNCCLKFMCGFILFSVWQQFYPYLVSHANVSCHACIFLSTPVCKFCFKRWYTYIYYTIIIIDVRPTTYCPSFLISTSQLQFHSHTSASA